MPSFGPNGYYLTLALLAACTVAGIGVAIRFRREVDDDLAPPTTKDVLDPLEKAYYSGLMHPSEIERIRESVKKAKTPVAAHIKPATRSVEAPTEVIPPPDSPPGDGGAVAG